MKNIFRILVMLFLVSPLLFSQHLAVKTEMKPIIDGTLDDCWERASKFDSFKQITPNILGDPTVRTEGYFLYDEENIYMAMKVYQSKNTIHASNGRKDSEFIFEGDFAGFNIDPMNNGSTAYFFDINPVNAVADGSIAEDGTLNTEWDGDFVSAVNVTEDYWIAEIQIPLNTLNFQAKDIQDWGILFYRNYTQNQEKITSHLTDIHNPHRLSNFDKITGLEDLKKSKQFRLMPYIYATNYNDYNSSYSFNKGKAGGEVLYSPNSSFLMLATINPDYAQLESDKEIINVSDLPTEYPEKRPFFTESSDFYPGAAVNTRNITDIKVGLKLKQLNQYFKYDVTGVVDKSENNWLLSNFKLSDNTTYLAEVITGLKNNHSRNDYNITTHMVGWFWDKKMWAYNWFGTINNPAGGKNEFETVNAVKWKSRHWETGIYSHYLSQFYNPNIIGSNYLSNQLTNETWLQYTMTNETGFFRDQVLGLFVFFYDLTSSPGNDYTTYEIDYISNVHLGDLLGNWTITIAEIPDIRQNFRYRKADDFGQNEIFEDAFSKFILITDKTGGMLFDVKSDYSKSIGFSFCMDNADIRKSEAVNIKSELFWKINSSTLIKYSLDYINIAGSSYQDPYRQYIHRIQAEYNLTDKINIRGIVQPNISRLPETDNYRNTIQAFNITFTWEYMPGSFIYLVYNKYEDYGQSYVQPKMTLENNQSFILKFNKMLQF